MSETKFLYLEVNDAVIAYAVLGQFVFTKSISCYV
jgi:hypothetical protein